VSSNLAPARFTNPESGTAVTIMEENGGYGQHFKQAVKSACLAGLLSGPAAVHNALVASHSTWCSDDNIAGWNASCLHCEDASRFLL